MLALSDGINHHSRSTRFRWSLHFRWFGHLRCHNTTDDL